MLLQFLINGLIKGSLYGLCALAFGLVYNTTRIFHIAFSALYVLAVYLFLLFYQLCTMPLFFSIILAILGTSLMSGAIEHFIYKPLAVKKSSLNVMLISSIGVMIIIINLIALFFGNETKTLSQSTSPTLHWKEIIITYNQLIQFGVSLFVIGVSILSLHKTQLGITIRAIRDDNELIQVFGINPFKSRLVIFFISGAILSIVSMLVGYDVGFDPYIGMPMLLNVIVAMIIGGMGKFEPMVLGGFLLGLIQSIAVYFFEARWETAITFIILIVFLSIRPQGIWGEKERKV